MFAKSSKVEASPKKFSRENMALHKEPALVKMNDVGTVTMDQVVTVAVNVI